MIVPQKTTENNLNHTPEFMDVSNLKLIENLEQHHKEEEAKRLTFESCSYEELLKRPRKEWLVEQVFGSKDLCMIYGEPSCGKTFVVIDLIVSICNGNKWADNFNVARPLSVAYCAGEGFSGLPSRFQAAVNNHGLDTIPNFHFFESIPQLFVGESSSNKEVISRFVTDWEEKRSNGKVGSLDVLVIDTLHTATVEADENHAKDMGVVLRACRMASEKLGCAIILVHHTNKGGTSERGSGSLRGAMDVMIEVKAETRNNSMHCSKLKDGKKWDRKSFVLNELEGEESVCIEWVETFNDQESLSAQEHCKKSILVELNGHPNGLTSNFISAALHKSPAYMRKLLNELVKESKCAKKLAYPEKKASKDNPYLYCSVSELQF